MCTKNLIQVHDIIKNERFFAGTRNYEEAKQFFENKRYHVLKLPCGQCMECRMEYSKTWAFRCMQETKEHEYNIMMTLTYKDEEVPKGKKIDKDTGEVSESLTLDHKDVQDFMKRLRKKTSQKFKFYMCGEYGTKNTERPHYHIIFFGLKIDDLVPYKTKKTEYGTHILYKSNLCDKVWGKGFVDLNEVNFETCAYVARYVTKKQKGHLSKEIYELRGQKPEYTQMSKGIGKNYFFKNLDKIKEEQDLWVKTGKGIKPGKPGRYFDKLLEQEDPEKLKEIKKHRIERSEEILKQILSQTKLTELEYQDQKDYITKQRTKKLKRC